MNDHSLKSFRPTPEWTQHLHPSTSTFQIQMSQSSDTPETRKLCRYCGHPEANAKDWEDIEPGKGEELGLCWDGEVCRHDAEAAINRLMSERDAAREDARRLAAGLSHMAAKSHHMAKSFDHLCICADCENARKALSAHEALTAKNQPATMQA